MQPWRPVLQSLMQDNPNVCSFVHSAFQGYDISIHTLCQNPEGTARARNSLERLHKKSLLTGPRHLHTILERTNVYTGESLTVFTLLLDRMH